MKIELLSYNDFLKKDYPFPYFYKLRKGKQSIYCFGSMHTFKSTDEQFKKLDKVWQDFLNEKNENKFVFIESLSDYKGGKKEIIRLGGEMGYVNYLCKKNKIEHGCPEPTIPEWYETLAKKFPRDVVAYYDFARICYQWHNTDKSTKFSDYIKVFLVESKRETGWKDIDFTLKGMGMIHEKIFGNKMNYNDFNFYYSNLNPTLPRKEMSIINKISFFDEQGVRDRVIIRKIIKKLEEGFSVLVVYGQTHVALIEPTIREYFSK